jgi:hypothetical protein
LQRLEVLEKGFQPFVLILGEYPVDAERTEKLIKGLLFSTF